MSSRAIRKAQRLREEQLQPPKAEDVESDEAEQEVDTRPKPSLFALLGGDDADEEEEANIEEDDISNEATTPNSTTKPNGSIQSSKLPAKKKKKKKKASTQLNGPSTGKTKTSSHTSFESKDVAPKEDDIDLALRSLASTSLDTSSPSTETTHLDPELEKVSSLLSIDTQYLNAANEMRRLFGRAALESDNHNEGGPPPRRRRGHDPGRGGLAAAVGGHHAPGGRGLAGLALRRNIFMAGKEEWPRGTSGGLGMELVASEDDGFTEYRFVHNNAYQDVQRQFEACVESMDPQRMVQLLHFNPYHISTLLQVSEIAKQEQDHSTSGELLERALFSFGRAVHSTFASNLAKGKAGFDFSRPENREFWLTAWRYMGNLGMRGTWRTSYEWGKLLLSLDPERDPYCVRLVIDQMALRARQPQQVLDLFDSRLYRDHYGRLPNVHMSKALAYHALGQADASRRSLFSAIKDHPWVLARLFQELSIDKIPPGIWGSQPRTDWEKLMSELYVTRAKDLWSTPEATALLVEVCSIPETAFAPPPIDDIPVTLDEARHVALTEKANLIALIPRGVAAGSTSAGDPFPPVDDLRSYELHERRRDPEWEALEAEIRADQETGATGGSILDRLLPLFRRAAREQGGAEEDDEADDD
ncbi:MAG: hypothetical protein M1817_003953 [Caeruleum heppii]|nr:MAG: hypothetical protein M1817_003953 [Caeruleum heppii]